MLTVSNDVPGCTDPAAANYNPAATVDDGSCCLDNIVTFNLSDSFGDGWSFAGGAGGIIFNGTTQWNLPGSRFHSTCAWLKDAVLLPSAWAPTEATAGKPSKRCDFERGQALAEPATFDTDFFFWAGSGDCVVYGCSDENACNYDAGANLNEGSANTCLAQVASTQRHATTTTRPRSTTALATTHALVASTPRR